MNAQLASKFIGMYVNEFTRDYGELDAQRSASF
jgi:Predicted periplasmic solute-binding protein